VGGQDRVSLTLKGTPGFIESFGPCGWLERRFIQRQRRPVPSRIGCGSSACATDGPRNKRHHDACLAPPAKQL
jgi:hypothetical protein